MMTDSQDADARELGEMDDDDLLDLATRHREGLDLTFREASYSWGLIRAELQRRPHLRGRY